MPKGIWSFDPLAKKPKLNFLLLLILLLLALFLRTFRLDSSPSPGLASDEAAIGYNAYSIFKTGRDEHGIFLPLYFTSFGDFKNPVLVYSIVPLFIFGDLSVKTIRTAAALWGLAAIIAVYWLGLLLTKNKTYALLAAAILTIMPWHLQYSRIAYEAIAFPALFILALASFFKWQQTKQFRYSLLSAVFWGLTFYSYTTARLWVPLTLGFLFLSYAKDLVNLKKQVFIFLLIFGFFLLPLVFWQQKFPGSLTDEFKDNSIFFGKPGPAVIIARFMPTFWRHWSPKFLFSKGDPNIRHSTHISSELLKSWAIFVLIGLFASFKFWVKKEWRTITLLLLIFPLAVSLTFISLHATRTIQATPFFSLIIALGIWWVFWQLRHFKKLKILLAVIFMLITIGEFSYYYGDYLYRYPKRAWLTEHGFEGSFPEAISWVQEASKDKNYRLYLSEDIYQAYIQGLFFTKADPALWQKYHQSPFGLIKKGKLKKYQGIGLVSARDCFSVLQEVVVLKKFGVSPSKTDFCGVLFPE